jgi:hypothetical protein
VGITIGDEFLESLKKVEEWARAKRVAAPEVEETEEVEEADFEVFDEDGA